MFNSHAPMHLSLFYLVKGEFDFSVTTNDHGFEEGCLCES